MTSTLERRNKGTVEYKKTMGWMLRTFKTREAKTSDDTVLFQARLLCPPGPLLLLTPPCSTRPQILLSEKMSKGRLLPESIQRKHLTYRVRLKAPRLYSFESRRERYIINIGKYRRI